MDATTRKRITLSDISEGFAVNHERMANLCAAIDSIGDRVHEIRRRICGGVADEGDGQAMKLVASGGMAASPSVVDDLMTTVHRQQNYLSRQEGGLHQIREILSFLEATLEIAPQEDYPPDRAPTPTEGIIR